MATDLAGITSPSQLTESSQISVTLCGNRKVFREAMKERDFLEGHQQMRGDVGHLPLELSRRLNEGCLLNDCGADF